MTTPIGIELELGQKWQECDPRFTRIVEVAGWKPGEGKVQLRCGPRLTWAKVSRFNGKRTGYSPCVSTPNDRTERPAGNAGRSQPEESNGR